MGLRAQIRFQPALLLLLVMMLCRLATAGEPDVLYLKNGERLTGINRGLEGEFLRWESSDGSKMLVPFKDVDRIEYRVPEQATGQPRMKGDSGGPKLGEPPHSDDRADSLTDASPETIPQPADDVPEPGTMRAAVAAMESAFDETLNGVSRLEFGGRFLHGNTDEDFLDVSGLFERKWNNISTQIDAGGQYGQSDGDETTNRWFANSTVDFDRKGNWIVFVTSKNENDAFENLSYRGSLSGGLGYRFFNEKNKRLITRVGPGVTYERFFDPVVERTTPDLFGEIELIWPLFDRTKFEHKTSIHPSIEDLGIFRLVSTYGLLIALDEEDRWSLKFGLRHEYNSEPNEDRKPSDYTMSILLVYTRP